MFSPPCTTLQVGRTGLLTPVALLRPVNIGGVMVERVTLHNEDEVNRLGLVVPDVARGTRNSTTLSSSSSLSSSLPSTPVSDAAPAADISPNHNVTTTPYQRVVVIRAGDVIPKITRVVGTGGVSSKRLTLPPIDSLSPPQTPSSTTTSQTSSSSSSSSSSTTTDEIEKLYRLPSTCPACGSAVVREPGGVLARCSGGFVCEAQAVERLVHFCSRDAMDIEVHPITTRPTPVDPHPYSNIRNNLIEHFPLTRV